MGHIWSQYQVQKLYFKKGKMFECNLINQYVKGTCTL
jgi:hypothetical protein